jgi:hypothetical protein
MTTKKQTGLPPELLEKRRNRVHHHSWDYGSSEDWIMATAATVASSHGSKKSLTQQNHSISPLSLSTPPSSSLLPSPATSNEAMNEPTNDIHSLAFTTTESRKSFQNSLRSNNSASTVNTVSPHYSTNAQDPPLKLAAVQDLIVVQRQNSELVSMPLQMLFKLSMNLRNKMEREVKPLFLAI